MNVIWAYFHFIYRDVVLIGYLLKQLFNSLLNVALENLFAVLGRPYQMVVSFVDGVGGSANNHGVILTD